MQPGRSDTPVSDSLSDRLKNCFDVLMNDPILESDDFDSLVPQKCRTFRIVLGSKLSKVRRAVQLDCNVAFDAEKIDNIATYAVLPAESLPEDLTAPKVLPQGGFRRCGVVSEFSTAGF